jgi:hypothetical protein
VAILVLVIIDTVNYADNIKAEGCDNHNPCMSHTAVGSPPTCRNDPLPNKTKCTNPQCWAADATGICNNNLGTPHPPACVIQNLTKCNGYCAQDHDEVLHFSDEDASCDDLMLPLLIPGFYQDAEYNCIPHPDRIAHNKPPVSEMSAH